MSEKNLGNPDTEELIEKHKELLLEDLSGDDIGPLFVIKEEREAPKVLLTEHQNEITREMIHEFVIGIRESIRNGDVDWAVSVMTGLTKGPGHVPDSPFSLSDDPEARELYMIQARTQSGAESRAFDKVTLEEIAEGSGDELGGYLSL